MDETSLREERRDQEERLGRVKKELAEEIGRVRDQANGLALKVVEITTRLETMHLGVEALRTSSYQLGNRMQGFDESIRTLTTAAVQPLREALDRLEEEAGTRSRRLQDGVGIFKAVAAILGTLAVGFGLWISLTGYFRG